jgi:hypothetical protein
VARLDESTYSQGMIKYRFSLQTGKNISRERYSDVQCKILSSLLLEIRLVHIERLTLIEEEFTHVHLIENMSMNTEYTRTMLLSILKLQV